MKEKINITLDKEPFEWITEKAGENHMSFSGYLNQILWKILEEEDEKSTE